MQSSAQVGEVFEIISFHNCRGGLGVKLAEYQLPDEGGPSSSHILVQDIQTGGRAASDGRLRRGDKLVRINGQPIEGLSLAAAVSTLGDAIESGRATLAVSRDAARLAFALRGSAGNDSGGRGDLDSAGSSEQAERREAVVPSDQRFGFPADSRISSDEDSGAPESANPRLTAVANSSAADSGQRSVDSSGSLSPHLLADGGSPISEISHEPLKDGGRGFPVCSTPISSFVDVASAAKQQMVANEISASPTQWLPADGTRHSAFSDTSKIKFEKLELAMSFLGIHLTKEQEAEIRLLAEQDGTGRIDYSKFVEKMRLLLQSRPSLLCRQSASAARETMATPLLQTLLASSSRPSPAAAAVRPMTSPSAHPLQAVFSPSASLPRESKVESVAPAAAELRCCGRDCVHLSDGRRKVCTRNVTQQTEAGDKDHVVQLQQRIRDLESALKAKDQLCHATELKASSMRKRLAQAGAQRESLRSRLALAEAAQRAAREAESDYEAVLSALELALGSEQRAALPERPSTAAAAADRSRAAKESSTATLKKVAILGCQLRKAEESRKVYAVATERLLSFARAVHNSADRNRAPDARDSTETVLNEDDSKNSPADARATSRKGIQQLADEALNVIKATHSLLEKQSLPFGWEEAYTADGKTYYLNHVTEETIWHHPLTKVDRRKLR